jgi:alkylation response protein AidB-like acyl-CoA dehydrogenase
MDFALTEDQMLLQEQMDKAVAKLSPLVRVRQHADGDGAFAEDIWAGLTDLGIPGISVAAQFGGLGMGLLEAALISEVFGRYTVPAPFLGAVVAAPIAITAAGSLAQQADLLPQIAAGELRVAVALSEMLAGARAGGGVQCRDGKLYGVSHFAIDVAGAHLVLAGDAAGGLHLVDIGASGLTISPLTTVDTTHSVAALNFDGVEAQSLQATNATVRRRVAAALRVVAAADLLGTGTRMMEMAVEYAKVRRQFGRPIGSFQAVKHLCVEMAAELEPGRALLWYAAYAQDSGLADAEAASLHAKAYLADAARIAARNSIEVHGGIGITDDLGLHYWFKRATFGGQVFGSPVRLRELVATTL